MQDYFKHQHEIGSVKLMEDAKGYFNGSVLCDKFNKKMYNFFEVPSVVIMMNKLGGRDSNCYKTYWSSRTIDMVSIQLLPYLSRWLDADFDRLLMAWLASRSADIETSKMKQDLIKRDAEISKLTEELEKAEAANQQIKYDIDNKLKDHIKMRIEKLAAIKDDIIVSDEHITQFVKEDELLNNKQHMIIEEHSNTANLLRLEAVEVIKNKEKQLQIEIHEIQMNCQLKCAECDKEAKADVDEIQDQRDRLEKDYYKRRNADMKQLIENERKKLKQ
jgi:hypothetical protein